MTLFLYDFFKQNYIKGIIPESTKFCFEEESLLEEGHFAISCQNQYVFTIINLRKAKTIESKRRMQSRGLC